MLSILGVVSNIASTNGLRADNPFIAKVLSPVYGRFILRANLTFKFFNYLLAAIHHRVIIEPGYRAEFFVKFSLPLLEGCIRYNPLLAAALSSGDVWSAGRLRFILGSYK